MCMKYLNATVECYQSVLKSDNSIVSLNGPLDKIVVNENSEGVFSVGGFAVVTHVNMLGTDKPENKEKSTLEKQEKLEVIVRLTRCDKDDSKQIGIDLDEFVIDPYAEENKRNIHQACFLYFNYKRVTEVDNIVVPFGKGTYVIKVLVKESGQNQLTIQSMTYLSIE